MMRDYLKSVKPFLLLLIIVLICIPEASAKSVALKTETVISGRTMGTVYHVKLVTSDDVETAPLKSALEDLLADLNRSMSTYDPQSEISRFNQAKLDHAVAISDDFAAVMQISQKIYTLTSGAWDGTVKPLINLWGFGPKGQLTKVPTPEAVLAARSKIGFHHIKVRDNRFLIKQKPEVTLSLASIAKGYGVDRLAAYLSQKSYTNFLVEIGGEVYAQGFNAAGDPWRVGINRPDPGGRLDAVYWVVKLSKNALATSGDYRQFYEISGKRYSHIIDPKTGYPVQTGVVSASVVAGNCALADGLATALMVMGPEKGLALINSLDGVDALIVVRDADGDLIDYFSNGFKE